MEPPAGPGERSEIGPYRLHGLIGRGGMGRIYLAEDPRLDRRVALKVLLPEDAVMPFQSATADTAADRLGQELAILISSRLDGVGEIATADALTILGRAGQDEIRPAEEDAALAASMGAGSMLRGTLVRSGARFEVGVMLQRTDDLEPLGRVTLVGSPEDPGALAVPWSESWSCIPVSLRPGSISCGSTSSSATLPRRGGSSSI